MTFMTLVANNVCRLQWLGLTKNLIFKNPKKIKFYDGCRIMTFVVYDVCRKMMFVAL